ncbi:ABC transporter ATP-binding protein [Maledivibacter halophilus]|uniref:NitT/TauT family transport system ATP-binding protein n=1 Tax=Maledivibacter halophilus TaxID=36842 RepID=A0A1T5M7U4_9FIRM|nr:ABC transporter ATP-binding protein [Maledivibacter halophilus]SKC84307.1 NitT/TauT family transport system ATP-binding protein [Maledivibacter halophilus]
MENIIEIKGLNKRFITEKKQEVNALRNINLNIKDQEFICILGPSGSGKSTLLRLMAGLIKPTTGSINVMGKAITRPILESGFVFQEYSLMPWRNIIDNVAFGLELRKYSKIERYKIAEDILIKFGLKDFTRSFPYELSGGMKQRAAIARAIATYPKILYMDEPFGALDAYTRFQMQKDLIEFWLKEKRTIVFVTHSVEEAVFLGTRVIIMSPRPGEIIADDNIDLDYPRNRWNEEFGSYFKVIMDLMNEVSEGKEIGKGRVI